jgi:hypothetical protein
MHKPDGRTGLNLAAASALASGGLPIIFEQSASAEWTFEEAIATFYVTVQTFLEHGLTEPFSPREAVARGKEE